METVYYYHAGTQVGDQTTHWSDHTRRTFRRAETEALALAEQHGGRPVVEWWDRRHGLRPGDCELVLGAEYVENEHDAN